MNNVDKYLIDLQGYLVLEGVLGSEELATINRLMDKQDLPEPSLVSRESRSGAVGLEPPQHMKASWSVIVSFDVAQARDVAEGQPIKVAFV